MQFKKNFIFLSVIIIFIIAVSSCKSSFEKIRTSNDPVKVYDAANEYYDNGKYMNAQVLYEVVLPYYKGKKEAEDLYYRYAYTYYNQKDYLLAAHYFESYASSFFNSPKKEECMYMAAYSEYLMSPSPKLDQGETDKAIEDFQSFINAYPNSDRLDECNNLIDKMRVKLEDKAFYQGELYYNLEKYISAIVSFENMLKDFPETQREEEVRYLILKSSFDYAKNSIYEKRSERYKDTLNKYNEFIKRYPNSEYKDKVEKIYSNSLNEIKKLKNGH